jgi:excisionase family DNA binding protein
MGKKSRRIRSADDEVKHREFADDAEDALDHTGTSATPAPIERPTIPSWASLCFEVNAPTSVLSRSSTHASSDELASAGTFAVAPLMTVTEAATLLRVTSRTVRRMIKRGELDAVRIGRSIRIRTEDIKQIIFGKQT